MLDDKLLKAINSGRCFLLVGAGPSCELGYPSWKSLAEKLYEKIKLLNLKIDSKSYDKYLKNMKYPEFFSLAEDTLGGRTELVKNLKPLLTTPENCMNGSIYNKLTQWPFACYLTTNYDDEIKRYLDRTGVHYETLTNKKDDFSLIRDGITNYIFKLHSDFNNPEDAIITSRDYQQLYINDQGQYYRDKLRQVFEMFNVLIIGHSLSDPDIEYILQVAKKNASPQHPIYMIAANYTKAEENEYLEKYNIVLLPYEDSDGKHARLNRILSTYDRFIIPRDRNQPVPDCEMSDDSETALSLFLFRKLQGVDISNSISPLILFTLYSSEKTEVSIRELIAQHPLNTLSKHSKVLDTLGEELDSLEINSLVKTTNNKYHLTKKGEEKVKDCNLTRKTESCQAYGQFIIDLKNSFDGITKEEEDLCKTLAKKIIIQTFKKRSLTIAAKVFTGQSSSQNDLIDIFKNITSNASVIQKVDLRLGFVDAMYNFIVNPTNFQKKYLASLSQGYFIFHLLGLDPKCSILRREIVERTFWLLDSNVLLPLLAVGCHNHEYAKDLLRMLKEVNTNLYTTDNLLREIEKHFNWADSFIKNTNTNSIEFLKAVLNKGSYQQNLFLDGYVTLCSNGTIGTYEDYLEVLSPNGIGYRAFKEKLEKIGIKSIHPSDIEGFKESDWGEIEQAKLELAEARKYNLTYKSDLQVASEAEIKIIIENLRSGKYKLPENPRVEKVYFISQSPILERTFGNQNMITWLPEAVYRYLSSLTNQNTDPDLLQKCMLNEYFYAGVTFIDKKAYLKFFGATIDAAKLSYQEEKSRYLSHTEETTLQELDETFDKTSDLEKPFFVSQMAWKMAEMRKQEANIAWQRANEAERKVKMLEGEKENAWRDRKRRQEEQAAGRERNLKDPKHLRKRIRQAKKRKKKK